MPSLGLTPVPYLPPLRPSFLPRLPSRAAQQKPAALRRSAQRLGMPPPGTPAPRPAGQGRAGPAPRGGTERSLTSVRCSADGPGPGPGPGCPDKGRCPRGPASLAGCPPRAPPAAEGPVPPHIRVRRAQTGGAQVGRGARGRAGGAGGGPRCPGRRGGEEGGRRRRRSGPRPRPCGPAPSRPGGGPASRGGRLAG